MFTKNLWDYLLKHALRLIFIPIISMTLIGCGGSSDDAISQNPQKIKPTPIPNQPPKANAGEDRNVSEGTLVTLDGSTSSDSDGSIVSYEWKEGDIILSTKKSFTKAFSVGTHIVTLKVVDNDGASDSDEIKVVIDKKPIPIPNQPPKANAGEDRNVSEGTLVTLDGSTSSDSDGSIVSYEWFENNSLISKQKKFSKVFEAGEHNITLKVVDDKGASAKDNVIIRVPDETSPTAIILIPKVKIDAPIDTNVTIKFSENIKTPTMSDLEFKDKDSNLINYAKEYNQTTFTLTLYPNAKLKNDTNYTITLKDTILDLANHALDKTVFEFKTERNSLLAKTGQKECFNYDTNEKEDCNETHKGQDGYYQKGLIQNFTRDDTTNIVTDHDTNLQWQDDINVTKRMTWIDANTTCDNLTLGGYNDWRLPSVDELETIVDYGKYKGDSKGSIGAINEVFKNIETTFMPYWSSTIRLPENPNKLDDKWDVSFGAFDGSWNYIHPLFSVRCVRKK